MGEYGRAVSDKTIDKENKTYLILYFRMSCEDWQKNFQKLEICNLGPDSLDEEEASQGKKRWEVTAHVGEWIPRVNAGGCRNYLGMIVENKTKKKKKKKTEKPTFVEYVGTYDYRLSNSPRFSVAPRIQVRKIACISMLLRSSSSVHAPDFTHLVHLGYIRKDSYGLHWLT